MKSLQDSAGKSVCSSWYNQLDVINEGGANSWSHVTHHTSGGQDNLWLIYFSFTDEQPDLSNSDTQWKDGEMTDILFIHQINDSKTIINDAKTIINDAKKIINHVYKEYQELITKHLVEIIKKSKNQIINERNQILSTIRTQEVKTCFVLFF